MPSIVERPPFKTRQEFLSYCAQRAPSEGLVLEFGVHRGASLRILGELFGPRYVHGFDSFKGLPEDWHRPYPKGHFATDPPTDLPGNCLLHIGPFARSLPTFLDQIEAPVAFVHIDCDLYSSTKTVLEHIEPRLYDGAIVVFDEFMAGGVLADEAAAWLEAGIPAKFVAQMQKKRVALQVDYAV